MCRALKVLCVAPDDAESLRALKNATVSAEWELHAGRDRPKPMPSDRSTSNGRTSWWCSVRSSELVRSRRERFPGMRIVADRDAPGATEVATSLDEVRGVVLGRPARAVRSVGAVQLAPAEPQPPRCTMRMVTMMLARALNADQPRNPYTRARPGQ